MTYATIQIQVDERLARAYNDATAEEKERLQSLLSLWLQEFGKAPLDLTELMDEISHRARERGLTPEILEALLRDE